MTDKIIHLPSAKPQPPAGQYLCCLICGEDDFSTVIGIRDGQPQIVEIVELVCLAPRCNGDTRIAVNSGILGEITTRGGGKSS